MGLAVSDPLGITSQGLDTLCVTSPKRAFEPIKHLVEQYAVDTIVIGIPRNMDGTEGAQARQVRTWARRLERATGRRVVFWDERLTTVQAHHAARSMAMRVDAKTKPEVDRIAATMILREYLDSKLDENAEHGPKGDTHEPPGRG